MSLVLYIAVAAVAAFRPVLLFVDFNQHVDASYQAVAHMLVAGLYVRYFSTPSSVALLYAANGLVAVEVVCAIAKVVMR